MALNNIVDFEEILEEIEEDSEQELEGQLLIDNEKPSTSKSIEKDKKRVKAAEKGKAQSKKQVKTSSKKFNKNKTDIENLNLLKSKYTLKFKDGQYQYEDYEVVKNSLKFPTFIKPSKMFRINDFKNFSILFIDNDIDEYIYNRILVSETFIDQTQNFIILKSAPFELFNQLLFSISNNKINFMTFHQIIMLGLLSNKIILSNKCELLNYMLYMLFVKLDMENKVTIKEKGNNNLNEDDEKYTQEIKEMYKNLKINNNNLCSFFKNSKILTQCDKIMFEYYQMSNFKAQLKYESFDGLTKLVLKSIRDDKLESFSFNTLLKTFSTVYSNISEKELLKHYIYIISNLNKQSQIPLFEYDCLKLGKASVVKVNKETFKKILEFTVIVKKPDCEFWSCFLPVQLFYSKDIQALDLSKILNVCVSTKTQKIMSDNNEKFYLYVNRKGIVPGLKNSYRLELSGANQNIIKFNHPLIDKNEFLLTLMNNSIEYEISDQGIILNDVKKAERFTKFTINKDNLIFDFMNINKINKCESKNTVYNVLIKYYNDFISFNIKLFKIYMFYHIYKNTDNIDTKKEIEDLIDKEKKITSALINQFNYPSSIDVLSTNQNIETTFFDDFNISEMTENISNDCGNYIKNKLLSLYEKYN